MEAIFSVSVCDGMGSLGDSQPQVGIETFSGSDDNKTPQHAVLLGMSGAGKSVTVCDLLTQHSVKHEDGVRIRRHVAQGEFQGLGAQPTTSGKSVRPRRAGFE